ncbi:hypothetical protein ATO8_18125 [Roseivivax marinus]|uniref:Uncharacterized protein n=1 Tax=Roseivivax marinus TaxID=1379903 RepID=W4HEP5_9RHOB|nr:hypothetical protein [Roseivivax marinus]ETW11247.1 hypothetical protein ATO8_18125 [Roseivivax marinus]
MPVTKITTKNFMKAAAELKAAKSRAVYDRDGSQKLEAATSTYEVLHHDILGGLQARLAKVHGTAKTHVLAAEDVISLAEEAEIDLERRGVPQQRRIGTELIHSPGGSHITANSYRGMVRTTEVHLKRVTDGWRLISAQKVMYHPGQKGVHQYIISPEAHADILAKANRNIVVRDAA